MGARVRGHRSLAGGAEEPPAFGAGWGTCGSVCPPESSQFVSRPAEKASSNRWGRLGCASPPCRSPRCRSASSPCLQEPEPPCFSSVLRLRFEGVPSAKRGTPPAVNPIPHVLAGSRPEYRRPKFAAIGVTGTAQHPQRGSASKCLQRSSDSGLRQSARAGRRVSRAFASINAPLKNVECRGHRQRGPVQPTRAEPFTLRGGT
jgi:hypothetical protein